MSLLLERYEEILDRLRAELIAHDGPRLVSVAVFGSVGRGTPRSPLFLDMIDDARLSFTTLTASSRSLAGAPSRWRWRRRCAAAGRAAA